MWRVGAGSLPAAVSAARRAKDDRARPDRVRGQRRHADPIRLTDSEPTAGEGGHARFGSGQTLVALDVGRIGGRAAEEDSRQAPVGSRARGSGGQELPAGTVGVSDGVGAADVDDEAAGWTDRSRRMDRRQRAPAIGCHTLDSGGYAIR